MHLFLIGGYLLYDIVLVSVVYQHESAAIGICMSPPSWNSLLHPTPSYPSRLSQSTKFEPPASYSEFPLANFAYGNEYISALLSQCVPPSPPFPNVHP